MTPRDLLHGVEARGGRLIWEPGDRLKYQGPACLLTARLRAALTRHRTALAALLSRPTPTLRLSEFARSGRLLRLRCEPLPAPIVLAADNADTSSVPPDVVIFYPDEIADIARHGPSSLALLWQTKRHFGPHLRSFPEEWDAP